MNCRRALRPWRRFRKLDWKTAFSWEVYLLPSLWWTTKDGGNTCPWNTRVHMQSHFVTVSSYIFCTGLELLQWAHPTPVFGCAPLSLPWGCPLGHPISSQYQQDWSHKPFEGSLRRCKADVHKNSSPVHRTAVKHPPCIAWKCSDTTSPQDMGAHHEADLHILSGGFFHQISTELIDFSPRESFPLSHKPTKTKPCKRRISIHQVGLETEICISSKYHIQQDTGISLQSRLHPGALNKPRFAEGCVDTSWACKTIYLSVPSVKEGVHAAKVCLVLPRASGNPSFILWLPSIKKKGDCFRALVVWFFWSGFLFVFCQVQTGILCMKDYLPSCGLWLP